MNPYQNLANAIVLQAVKDWRKAIKRLDDNPESKHAMQDKRDAEKFLMSAWCRELSSADSGYILRKLKEEVAA